MEELNTNQTKEEKRAEKTKLRETSERQVRRGRIFKKVGYWIIGLLIILGGGWLLIKNSIPQGTDYSQSIPVLDRNHIADGTTYASYNSNPPTSGPHYPSPALTRFYDKELRDEQIVHNLEHGNVWISYKPALSAEVIKNLKGFANSSVIVSPRSANDSDIALSAWGRLDKFNLENGKVDRVRIKDFILRYQNQGPEKL